MRFCAFGSGWAGAAGRVGGIAAPAAVMGGENGFGNTFVMFAAVFAAVVAVIVLLGEETKGLSLEDISG